LDEPFSNIDTHRKIELGQEIRRVVEHQDISAVFVTHDQVDAFSLADKVAVMVDKDSIGTIAQVDTPNSIYRRPSSPEVALLTGPGVIISGTQSESSTAETILGRIPVICDGRQTNRFLIRPENLRFNPSENGIHEVILSCCTGPSFQLIVDIQGTRFRIPHPTQVAKGLKGTIEVLSPCIGW
jgi:iron(III) transport system ATP-binding protein